jgi:hypothetical protein
MKKPSSNVLDPMLAPGIQRRNSFREGKLVLRRSGLERR